jgi:hypothetical protein
MGPYQHGIILADHKGDPDIMCGFGFGSFWDEEE